MATEEDITNEDFETVLQKLAGRLRILPWDQRTEFLETRLLVVTLMTLEETPDSDERRFLLSALFRVYTKLLERIEDGNFTCLDHAALVMIFRSSHMPTAARWIQENASDDKLDQWLEANPYIAVFHDMTQHRQSVVLH